MLFGYMKSEGRGVSASVRHLDDVLMLRLPLSLRLQRTGRSRCFDFQCTYGVNISSKRNKKWKSEYNWSYCYGAIDPIEGKTVFLQTETVNLDWTEAFLIELKKQYPGYEHIVVWDGAGYHPKESEHDQIPEDIHILMLPPYSPELNPIEKP